MLYDQNIKLVSVDQTKAQHLENNYTFFNYKRMQNNIAITTCMR